MKNWQLSVSLWTSLSLLISRIAKLLGVDSRGSNISRYVRLSSGLSIGDGTTYFPTVLSKAPGRMNSFGSGSVYVMRLFCSMDLLANGRYQFSLLADKGSARRHSITRDDWRTLSDSYRTPTRIIFERDVFLLNPRYVCMVEYVTVS